MPSVKSILKANEFSDPGKVSAVVSISSYFCIRSYEHSLAGWNQWTNMTGIQCDRRAPVKNDGMIILRTVVRPAMMYGLETVVMTKRHEADFFWVRQRRTRLGMSTSKGH